jgi:hypothetical protein
MGRDDIALQLAENLDYPSWGYMVSFFILNYFLLVLYFLILFSSSYSSLFFQIGG